MTRSAQLHRRKFLAGLGALMAVSRPAYASDVSHQIVTLLVEQGYTDITTERTLLGRVRILASRPDGTREIVVNPWTGEILRDIWIPADGSPASPFIAEADDYLEDDRDEDEEDEEDDEDEDEEDDEDEPDEPDEPDSSDD